MKNSIFLSAFLLSVTACNRALKIDNYSLVSQKIVLAKGQGLLNDNNDPNYFFEYKKQLDNFFALSRKAAEGDVQSLSNFKNLIEKDPLSYSFFSSPASNVPSVLRTAPFPIKLDIYPSEWKTAANRLDLLYANNRKASWSDKAAIFMLNRVIVVESITYVAKNNSLLDFSEVVNFYPTLNKPIWPEPDIDINDLLNSDLLNKIYKLGEKISEQSAGILLKPCKEVKPDICFLNSYGCVINEEKCAAYEIKIEKEKSALPKFVGIEPRGVCAEGTIKLYFKDPTIARGLKLPNGWKIGYADIISWEKTYIEIKLRKGISSANCFPLKWQKEVDGRGVDCCGVKMKKIYEEPIGGTLLVIGPPTNFQVSSPSCSKTIVEWGIIDFSICPILNIDSVINIDYDNVKIRLASFPYQGQSTVPDKVWDNLPFSGALSIDDTDPRRYYQLIVTGPCGKEYLSEKKLAENASQLISIELADSKSCYTFNQSIPIKASIDCPAPPGGVPLKVASSSPFVVVQNTNLTIPEGSTSVTTSVLASTQVTNSTLEISSTLAGYTTGKSPVIRIRPSCSSAEVPALESVFFSANGVQSVVAQNTDGAYSVIVPSIVQFRVRAPWLTDFEVFMDKIGLQQVKDDINASSHPEFDKQGYFWYSSGVIPGEGFYKISAVLPLSLRTVTLGKQVSVEIRNFSLDDDWPRSKKGASLSLTLNVGHSSLPFLPNVYKEEPNTVFDHGENSKDFPNPYWFIFPGPLDEHSKWSIVARKVSVAGWLIEAFRNDGSSMGAARGQTEDWKYKILIDNDYIERNYGATPLAFPLANTVLPGHPGTVWPYTQTEGNDISFAKGQRINAGLFLMPHIPNCGEPVCHGIFESELNAWHKSARGTPPNGWINDTDTAYSDNAWPFDPMLPFRTTSAEPPLQAGDYVVISGTLWEDGHKDDDQGSPSIANCWNHHFKDQHGWLEIHPVDMVRRIREPVLQKTSYVISICTKPGETASSVSWHLKPKQPRGDNSKKLNFKIIDDSRFTKTSTINFREESIVEGSDGPSLFVHLNVGNTTEGGCFKAVYLVWWE